MTAKTTFSPSRQALAVAPQTSTAAPSRGGGLAASTTDADASVSGPSTRHVLHAISRMGDPDGDGIEDLAVGNTGCDGAAPHGGAIYTFSGALSGAVTVSATWPMLAGGTVSTGASRMNIAPAGDTHNDGHEELLIGGVGANQGWLLLGG